MGEPVFQRSLAAGELAPALTTRADLAKYTLGLRTCRNFIIQRHGGAATRPSLQFIGPAKTTDVETRLLRYVSEVTGESCLLEHGEGYLRVWQNGALVHVDQGDVSAWGAGTAYVIGDLAIDAGVVYYCTVAHTNQPPPDAGVWHPLPDAGGGLSVYEIGSPFDDPLDTAVTQSGRVLAFTHPDVRPHDLVFIELTRWVMRPVETAPKVAAPTNLMISGTVANGRTFAYVVTAAHPATYEESLPSGQLVAAGVEAPTEDAPHIIDWDTVLTPPATGDPSPEYYVYCDPDANGTFGFIGVATGATTFRNPGLVPDFSLTPPIARDLFNATDEYPAVAAFHQQRRFFARTRLVPDGVWGSRIGLIDNYGRSSPLQDDDALEFRIAGNNNHAVEHLLGLKRLLALTGGGEWGIGRPQEALTPFNLPADQETYVGADATPPVVIGNAILYVQARGSILRELRFDQEVEGLAGRDLTVFAGHLFDGRTLVAIDYQQVPHSIVWCCRSDGTLLGLTYLHDQDVWGWHRHDTAAGGRIEDVCVVPEADEDVVYVLVRRTIGGGFVRYIERLTARTILDWNQDAHFLDAMLSYQGAPVASVAGLDHLEGQVVAVVADGVALGTATVAAGAVTLPGGVTASTIHVGLPVTGQLETLDLDVAGSQVRDRRKRVSKVTLHLETSNRAFHVGPDASHLTPYRPAAHEAPAIVNFTGAIELNITSRFSETGRVLIQQTTPLPLTVLGVIPNVELGN